MCVLGVSDCPSVCGIIVKCSYLVIVIVSVDGIYQGEIFSGRVLCRSEVTCLFSMSVRCSWWECSSFSLSFMVSRWMVSLIVFMFTDYLMARLLTNGLASVIVLRIVD